MQSRKRLTSYSRPFDLVTHSLNISHPTIKRRLVLIFEIRLQVYVKRKCRICYVILSKISVKYILTLRVFIANNITA